MGRVYFFTGKGGVGKSILSLSYAAYLKKSGKKILHLSAEKNLLLDSYADQLRIPHENFDLSKSSYEYISRKLGSVIAFAVTKAPFYKAALNMVPGMNHIIFLGQVIDLLDQDKDLTIIFDAPASGHFITMLHSLDNFSHIFSSGILFEDIHQIKHKLMSKDYLSIQIISLPTLLSLHEAQELKDEVTLLGYPNPHLILNNCLSKVSAFVECKNLPPFMQKKIDNEKLVFQSLGASPLVSIPWGAGKNVVNLVEEKLMPCWEQL